MANSTETGPSAGRWERCAQYIRTPRGGEYDGFLIAEVCMSIPEYSVNANVIAAAPELLSALENILHRHSEDEFIPTEYWDDAKRACAKARGR